MVSAWVTPWWRLRMASEVWLMIFRKILPYDIITSSYGNIFRVTGPLCGEFSSQRPVTRSFDVFFDQNKRLSKQSKRRWFETPSWLLWRRCNEDTRPLSQGWRLSVFNATKPVWRNFNKLDKCSQFVSVKEVTKSCSQTYDDLMYGIMPQMLVSNVFGKYFVLYVNNQDRLI